MELVVSSLATVRNTADGFHKLFAQFPPELTSFITGIPTRKQSSPFVFMAASSPSSCRISGTHSLLPRVVSFSLLDLNVDGITQLVTLQGWLFFSFTSHTSFEIHLSWVSQHLTPSGVVD